MKHATRLALSAAVMICLPTIGLEPSASAAQVGVASDFEPFPDDWFFSGAERPKPLKELEGRPAKAFSAAQWRGDKTSLSELRGKVVVLDFWATWCGPCMAAIPKNVAMVDKYGDEGLAFIGIHDTKNGWDKVDSVIQEKGINYPVALDAKEGNSGVSTKASNLQFWPTYVVIDREGIVRGAGLKPGKVEDAVKLLLAEPYEGAPIRGKDGASSFPDEWFNGGDKRLDSFRKAEGKPLKPIEASDWIGEAPQANAWTRRVVIVQFVRPEFGFSMAQLDAIMPVAEKFSRQGVSLLIVCDSKGDWERMGSEIESRKIVTPVAFDTELPDGELGSGVIGQTFGVSFGPATAVVDRNGVVRAVGLKPDHLEAVLNKLLAERIAPPKKDDAKGDDAG